MGKRNTAEEPRKQGIVQLSRHLNFARIDESVVQGLFTEHFNDASAYVGLDAAPPLWTDSIDGWYYYAKTFAGLSLEEQGFDPLTPLSLEAPSRPIRVEMEKAQIGTDRYSEHVFLDRNSTLSRINAGILGFEDYAATKLAKLYRDRHELQAARLFKDVANYATSKNNIDPLTAGELMAAVELAVDSIAQPDKLRAVMSARTAMLIRQSPDFVASFGGGNAGFIGTHAQLQEWFRDMFGLEAIIGRALHNDNKTAPNAPVKRRSWDRDDEKPWLGIVSISDDASINPTFAATVAFTPTFEDPSIAQTWVEEVADPRGTKTIAESLYRVTSLNREQGVMLLLDGTT